MKTSFLFPCSAILLGSVMLFSSSCKKEEIVVTADKTSAAIGEVITFSCLATDGKMKGTFVTWDFGDGTTTANQSTAEVYNNNNLVTVSHAYMAAGTYTASVILNKSSRPGKKNGTTTYSTSSVTINAYIPTFEVNNALGSQVSSIMVGQQLTFVNTTAVTDKPQADMTYSWTDNGVEFSTEKNPASYQVNVAGKHTFKLKIYQGVASELLDLFGIGTPGTETWSDPVEITVGGQSLSNTEMQAMIGGQWTITTSASFAGAAYTNTGNPCFASASLPTQYKLYSKVFLDPNGSADWGIDDYPSNEAGNIVSNPSVTITVVNATTLSVSGLITTTPMSEGNPNGLYTTASINGGSMTLTRVEYGDTGSSSCPFTDTYTITLTR
ncbi:MAG: hypothetical protein HYY40_14295 [Bacteroidetes bacterium]|nr:hypothetical protein [Bacteroidota bacterium]